MIARALKRVARCERAILIAAFVAFAGTLCLILTFTNPIGQVPDEPAHALRADSLRLGTLIGSRWMVEPKLIPEDMAPARLRGPVIGQDQKTGAPLVSLSWMVAGGPADPKLREAALAFHFLMPDQKVTSGHRRAAQYIPWGTPVPMDFPNTIQYAPTLYAGAALGIAAAQHLGFGPYDAMIGARLANVALFLVLGSLALRVAAAGRLTLFVILTLPMTVYLAASISQDGLMIAAAALAAALASRLWLQPSPAASKLTLLAVVLIAVITARPTNAPLALLLLLPQPGIAWRPRLVAFAAVTLATIGWSMVLATTVAVPLRPEAELTQQLIEMGNAPGLIFTATWAAARELGGTWLEQMVGRFGMLTLALPNWALTLYLLPVGMAVFGDLTQPTTGPRLRPLGAIAIIGAGCILIVLAQYLTWTKVGAQVLDGVQGRYFLPLAIVIGLGIAGLAPVAARWPRGLAVLGVLVGPVIGAITVPAIIIIRYYVYAH